MQTAYERDEADELRAALPSRCPLGDDGSACRVGLHGHRLRKTGPQIPLMVARCHRHELSFTVYPPGYVPYARTAAVPVDLQGRRVEPTEPTEPTETGESGGSGGSGASIAVVGTMWEGTADAAAGVRWPETVGSTVGGRRTQGRRIAAAAVLFGLGAEPRVRERVATVLDVATLTLHEAAERYSKLTGWRERAELLIGLLGRCLAGGLPRALLAAGHLTGLWGRPSRWDPGGGCLRLLV